MQGECRCSQIYGMGFSSGSARFFQARTPQAAAALFQTQFQKKSLLSDCVLWFFAALASNCFSWLLHYSGKTLLAFPPFALAFGL